MYCNCDVYQGDILRMVECLRWQKKPPRLLPVLQWAHYEAPQRAPQTRERCNIPGFHVTKPNVKVWERVSKREQAWPTPKQSIAGLVLASKMFPNWLSFENQPINFCRDSGRHIVRILMVSSPFHFLFLSYSFQILPQKLTIWEYIWLMTWSDEFEVCLTTNETVILVPTRHQMIHLLLEAGHQVPRTKQKSQRPRHQIRLMEEILHQLRLVVYPISHCLHGFIYPTRCRISYINKNHINWRHVRLKGPWVRLCAILCNHLFETSESAIKKLEGYRKLLQITMEVCVQVASNQ